MWDLKTFRYLLFRANKILEIFPLFSDFLKGKKVKLILLYFESKLSLSKPLVKFLKIYRNNDTEAWLLVSPLHIKGHCISFECSCDESHNLYLTEADPLQSSRSWLEGMNGWKSYPFLFPNNHHLSC